LRRFPRAGAPAVGNKKGIAIAYHYPADRPTL